MGFKQIALNTVLDAYPYFIQSECGKFYRGDKQPGSRPQNAYRFATRVEAENELAHMQSAGLWPLFDWKVGGGC